MNNEELIGKWVKKRHPEDTVNKDAYKEVEYIKVEQVEGDMLIGSTIMLFEGTDGTDMCTLAVNDIVMASGELVSEIPKEEAMKAINQIIAKYKAL